MSGTLAQLHTKTYLEYMAVQHAVVAAALRDGGLEQVWRPTWACALTQKESDNAAESRCYQTKRNQCPKYNVERNAIYWT